jgi:hypothetical protein
VTVANEAVIRRIDDPLNSVVAMRVLVLMRVGAGPTFAAWALRLLLGLFPGPFGRFMMTDDATGAGAEKAMMTGIMPGDATDGRALKAASRLHWSRDSASSHQNCNSRWH